VVKTQLEQLIPCRRWFNTLHFTYLEFKSVLS